MGKLIVGVVEFVADLARNGSIGLIHSTFPRSPTVSWVSQIQELVYSYGIVDADSVKNRPNSKFALLFQNTT